MGPAPFPYNRSGARRVAARAARETVRAPEGNPTTMGAFLLLINVLGLVVLVGSILAALIRRRFAVVRRLSLIGGAWLALYGAALLAVSLTSAPVQLAPGQERCFDEMCFSVTQVTASAVGAPAAAQRYYTVTIQLRNAARGTAQKPDSPAVRLIDQRGQLYV